MVVVDGAVVDVVFAVDNKPVVDNVLMLLPEKRVIVFVAFVVDYPFVVDYLVGVVYAVKWYVVHRRHVDFCQYNWCLNSIFVSLPRDFVPAAQDIRTVASEALRVVFVVVQSSVSVV